MDRTLLVWAGVGLSLALAIPVFGLESNHELAPPLSVVPQLVRSIDYWALGAAHPQHVRVLFSMMWLLAPLLVAAMIRSHDRFFPLDRWRPERASRVTAAAIVLAAALVAVTVFALGSGVEPIPDAQQRRSLFGLLLRSRISSGVFGSAIIFFTCYAVLAACIYSYRTLQGARQAR
jgi:hypothetical protein